MSIVFGIPKREVVNKEQYPDVPVLKMELVQDKGFNRRFSLNQKALEILNITPGLHSVIFAFDDTEKKAYIAKHNTEDSVVVGKNQAFSNKRYYEYICKMKDLNSSVDNYFELTNMKSVGDIDVYELVQLSTEPESTDNSNPIVDKEIEHLVEEATKPTNGYDEEETVETVADYEPHGDVW